MVKMEVYTPSERSVKRVYSEAMQLTLKQIPIHDPNVLPSSYVLIGVYGGTSTFPMCTFFVVEAWWEMFRVDPDIVVENPTEVELLPPLRHGEGPR